MIWNMRGMNILKMKQVIYFDNNATTAVDPAVFEAMKPFFCERYGNASSIHSFGGTVMADVEKARIQVAELLGADFRDKDGKASEIIFTSGGTEGDNAAIAAGCAARPDRKRIVTSRVEHPAVLTTVREYERRGYEVVLVPVDHLGRLDMSALEEAVNDDTAIVSLMWANNEIGNIYNVEGAAEIAHRHGALFHTDAVQAVGKVPLSLADSRIDFLSMSGHKIHGPKGIGILYVRRGTRFKPLITGGHQERGRRGGTENVPGIAGIGKACEIARLNMAQEVEYLSGLRDYLESKIISAIPCCRVNGDKSSRLPNTSSISFDGIEGEAILSLLDIHGICASSGSACTTGSLDPSHVLRAMGVPYNSAHGTIRFSLSKFNTREEVDRLAEVLPPVIKTLRDMSPFWKE